LKLKITRRQLFHIFIAGIGLTSVVAGAETYKHRTRTKRVIGSRPPNPKVTIPKSKIKSGYIVKLDDEDRIVAPGWSVSPGDKIGLALNAKEPGSVSGTIVFMDAAGRPAFELDGVELGQQDFANEEPWLRGAGFAISGSGRVPSDLPSGVYFAANDPTLFIVVKKRREESSSNKKKIVILISTNTFNAYSVTKKKSLYFQPHLVPAVSFYRPQTKTRPQEWRPFLKWILLEEPFGLDVEFSYITDFDMDEPASLEGADMVIILGHSEYWTRKAREVFDAFVEAGGHALVASGNTMWWQVRYEGDARSVLVCYKPLGSVDTSTPLDPMAGTEAETTNWDLPVLNYPIIPSIGGGFTEGGYGIFRQPKAAKGWGGYMVIDGKHPLLRSTGLSDGDCFPFYRLKEYDGAPILGFDARGMPVPDLRRIGAHKFELLGFDLGYRGGHGHTIGTMHVMQRTPQSGYLFNIGAKDFALTWTRDGQEPWRRSTQIMKRLFQNFVSDALSGISPFSEPPRQEQVVYAMTVPWPHDLPAGLPWLTSPPACQPKTHPNIFGKPAQ
jgi:hypothetical protein